MKKSFSLLLFFILVRLTCLADGYWLELLGNGRKGDTLFIRIQYGGVDEQKTRYINNGAALDKMKDYQLIVVDPVGKQHQVPLKQAHDCWIGYYVPVLNGSFQVLATNNQLPVVEREDSLQNIKPMQYLCAVYNVGKGIQGKRPFSYLYLEVVLKNDKALITPFVNGKPSTAGTPLRVFLPDNNDKKVFVTNEGVAVLPLSLKGIYLIRLDDIDKQEGFYKGKKYYAVRHRCDYTLVVK